MINGEIYDPDDTLRTELATVHGYHFPSHADTELVIALYTVYGAPEFLSHLRGEFSLVLYDEREPGAERIILARDRFGIKPLFYTVDKDRLFIAAEAKAWLGLGWEPEWDVGSVATGAWMLGERTLFRGVQKVSPAGWVEVGVDGSIKKGRYWDMDYKDKVSSPTPERPLSGP